MTKLLKLFDGVERPIPPLKPLLSVLMITFNHVNFLAEAIDGVLSQKTEFPFELIIGDDCSTDGTREIALDYQRRFPHIIQLVFPDKNLGMHKNFLHSLSACKGDFVAFCEGDDYWVDDCKLQIQVEYLTLHPEIGLCFHPVFSKSMIENDLGDLTGFHGDGCFKIPVSELIRHGGAYCPSCSLVFRRSKILNNPWIAKDLPVVDYFIQVISAYPEGAGYIDRVMGVYRTNVHGSFSSSMRILSARLDLLDKLLMELEEFNSYLELRFFGEINEYKKRIQFSILQDSQISFVKKIYFLLKYDVKFCFYEKLKISCMLLSPTIYAKLVLLKIYFYFKIIKNN